MSALSAAASDEDADTIRQQRERIEELESQLEVARAGGVGELASINHRPIPVAWLIRDSRGALGGGQWLTQRSADLCQAHDEQCEIVPLYAGGRI